MEYILTEKGLFVSIIVPLILQVDSPPAKVEEQNNPLLLTIGPMITMSMTSIVMGYTALNNVLNGSSTWGKAAPSLVICGAMFASVFVLPLFTRHYEKKMKIKAEKLRQEKYTNYVKEKRNAIIDAKKQQTSILKNNYMKT